MRPTFHRLRTHSLAQGLQRSPDAKIHAMVWGPVSIIWERSFKLAEKERSHGR